MKALRYFFLAALLLVAGNAVAQFGTWVAPAGPPSFPPLNPVTALCNNQTSFQATSNSTLYPLQCDTTTGALLVKTSSGGATGNVNLAQVNGATVNVGTGAASTGTARVAVSSDSTIGLVAGSALIGKVGIDQTTPGSTNGVSIVAATTGGCAAYHLAGGTTSGTNSTSVKASAAGALCGGVIINTSGTIGYLRLYDTAGAPTCSSATGATFSVPIPASASGAGTVLNFGAAGVAFSNGIGFCVTGGGTDTDNSNAPVGIYVSLSYK